MYVDSPSSFSPHVLGCGSLRLDQRQPIELATGRACGRGSALTSRRQVVVPNAPS